MIVELTPKYYSEYTQFVLMYKESWIYMSLKFKDLLEAYLKCTSNYMIYLDENSKIQGVLPLMIMNGSSGKVINSLPFYGSNGGILASSSGAFNELFTWYNTFIKRSEVASATYIEHPLLTYDIPKINSQFIDRRISQITNISEADNLMDIFHYKTRNMVRKAIKNNIEVKVDNTALPFLIKTHQNNMKSIGGIAKDDSFFYQLENHLEEGNDFNIYVAYLNGVKIAALLILYFNKTVEYFTPVIVQDYRHLQPLSLIIYKAMQNAKDKGYFYWNWGATWISQEGVYRFKKRWGAKDTYYNYYTTLNNSSILSQTPNYFLNEYKNFYVVPFTELIATKRSRRKKTNSPKPILHKVE